MKISPEKSRLLWMKKDHKTLQKICNKSGNYEKINFRQCMKHYENGGVMKGRKPTSWTSGVTSGGWSR